ncbi:MAG: DNA translocase FtsK 4TM domain-containing protein, partial [Eggerthellaceae bacterium]|nr:DNA translocase FtsK 4TM domain-containing protein [Eggerthellaceae bacterium]
GAAGINSALFDASMKRDIIAIIIAGLSLISLVILILPPGQGIVTSFLSDSIRTILGIGAYLLPIVLLIVCISLFTHRNDSHFATRMGIGLILILIALMTFLALLTPHAQTSPSVLMEPRLVKTHGGVFGAAFAWVLLNLFGKVVAIIITIGIALTGIVIVGFSLTRAVDKVKAASIEQRERLHARAAVQDEMTESQLVEGLESTDLYPQTNATEASLFKRLYGRFRVFMKLDEPYEEPDEAHLELPQRNTHTSVPRDLSRPQRATISLNSRQRVHENSEGNGFAQYSSSFERASDNYWPQEYAYEAEEDEKEFIGEDLPRSDQHTHVLTHNSSAPDVSVSNPSSSAQTTRVLSPTSQTPKKNNGAFKLPPKSMLQRSRGTSKANDSELRTVASDLTHCLESFNIMARVVGWVAGPTVTLFKVDLPSGVRVNRVTNLQDDIALALAAPGVRIFAPIPGTNYVGIEVPNATRQPVLLGDVLKDAKGPVLEMAIGKDVEGHNIISDLAKMPHLLIGGTTGSGKSVSINAMIMSLLMRATPDEVRLIMIDPKRVEFTPYNGIPHLYVPVVTENKEAASALAWGVAEMERRLKVMSKVGVRNITEYNNKVEQGTITFDTTQEDEPEVKKLPYIVIIIDELADLMMNVGKEVETSIARLAQLARAAGIHLIVATQRPSTNVVTGLIKANITNRISFNVASGIDSRVILDTPGAEHLIGLGDMLLDKPELAKPQRLQGCFVSNEEIAAVVEYLKAQGEPEYHNEILSTHVVSIGTPGGLDGDSQASSLDPLFWEAAEIVVSSGMGSTSGIQRRLSVGYSRAGRIMDMLEEMGIVGPQNGSKPREVLVDEIELESLRALEEQNSSM